MVIRRKKSLAEMALEPDMYADSDYQDYTENPGNLVDPSLMPTQGPSAVGQLQQLESPTMPYKNLTAPDETGLDMSALPSNSIGGINQYTDVMAKDPGAIDYDLIANSDNDRYSVMPGGVNAPSYRDLAMKSLGYDQEKYAKRGIGGVLADIGKGALRGLSSGGGIIPGIAAGASGELRQAERTGAINRKAADLQQSSEDIRKNITAENTRQNTLSQIDARNQGNLIRQQDADTRSKKVDATIKSLEANKGYHDAIIRTKNRGLALKEADSLTQILEKGGDSLPLEIRQGIANQIQALRGVAIGEDFGSAALQTKQDLVPGMLVDDEANNKRVLLDRFNGATTDTGLESEKLWQAMQREKLAGLRRSTNNNPKDPKLDPKQGTIPNIIGGPKGYTYRDRATGNLYALPTPSISSTKPKF